MIVLPRQISDIVKNPCKSFEDNPIGIFEVISFACEAEFDLDETLFAEAADKVKLLSDVPVNQVREYFEKIISSQRAGKGLTLLTKVGAMQCILGQYATENLSKGEMNNFSIYAENIDKTKQTRLRRIALFYKCFAPKRAEAAIKKLNYSPEDETFLLDAVYLLDKVYFLKNKYELKKFLVQYGMERYEFLDNLSKAQRIVYDLPVNRVVSRQYVLDNIREYNEPIFIEDLAIDIQDLRDEGIAEKDFDRILAELLDLSHMKPNLNTKESMLEYARKYSKNKWAATFKKLKYIK